MDRPWSKIEDRRPIYSILLFPVVLVLFPVSILQIVAAAWFPGPLGPRLCVTFCALLLVYVTGDILLAFMRRAAVVSMLWNLNVKIPLAVITAVNDLELHDFPQAGQVTKIYATGALSLLFEHGPNFISIWDRQVGGDKPEQQYHPKLRDLRSYLRELSGSTHE